MPFLFYGPKHAQGAQGDTVQSRARQPFPLPSGSSWPVAPQGVIGLFGCQGAVLTKIQLAVRQNTQISFHGAALLLLIPFILMSRVDPSQV